MDFRRVVSAKRTGVCSVMRVELVGGRHRLQQRAVGRQGQGQQGGDDDTEQQAVAAERLRQPETLEVDQHQGQQPADQQILSITGS